MNNSAPLSAAPLTGHPFGGRFAARLMDFSVRDMPWNRRLWSPGTVLTLQELLEAGPWVDAQVLSPAALQWLCGDLERLAGDDAGIGGQEVRRHLRDTLHADLSEHSRYRRRLRDLISLVEESYLTLLARSRLTRRNRSGLKPVGMLRVAAGGNAVAWPTRAFRRSGRSVAA